MTTEILSEATLHNARIQAAERIAVTGSNIQALARRHRLPFLDYLSAILIIEAWRIASNEPLDGDKASVKAEDEEQRADQIAGPSVQLNRVQEG